MATKIHSTQIYETEDRCLVSTARAVSPNPRGSKSAYKGFLDLKVKLPTKHFWAWCFIHSFSHLQSLPIYSFLRSLSTPLSSPQWPFNLEGVTVVSLTGSRLSKNMTLSMAAKYFLDLITRIIPRQPRQEGNGRRKRCSALVALALATKCTYAIAATAAQFLPCY